MADDILTAEQIDEIAAQYHPQGEPWPKHIHTLARSHKALLAEVERLRAAAPASEDDERERWRFVVAESIYQRHAAGWRAVLHEIIEPPCWNRSNPDDTEPMTADQVAWLKGEPLPAEVERLRTKPSQYDEATADNVIALTRTIVRQQAELDALRAAAPASEDDEVTRD